MTTTWTRNADGTSTTVITEPAPTVGTATYELRPNRQEMRRRAIALACNAAANPDIEKD